MTRREHVRRETQPGADFGERFFSERHRWPRFFGLYSLPPDLTPHLSRCENCDAPVALCVSLASGKARAVTLDLNWEWQITRTNAEGKACRWTIRHKCVRRI